MSDGIDWRVRRPHETTSQHGHSVFQPTVLQGKTVLVTGGGSGIGLAIAKQFGLHGASVAIMGRSAEKLKNAEAHLRTSGVTNVLTVAGDVRDHKSGSAAVAAVVQRFGALDVLVNNAAGNFLCLQEDLSLNGFKSVVDIDLVGTWNMSTAALAAFRRAKSGVIINISATLHYGATPYVTHASAAKAGVDALTRGLAAEVRCNSFSSLFV